MRLMNFTWCVLRYNAMHQASIEARRRHTSQPATGTGKIYFLVVVLDLFWVVAISEPDIMSR
jgi:hypothetical protein